MMIKHIVKTLFFAVLISPTLPQSLAHAFTTIINSPPAVIGNSQTLDSDTQLNVSTGGVVGSFLKAGQSNGSSTNVEVNIVGGAVDWGLSAYAGSTVNISGGAVGNFLTAYSGSSVNIDGGVIGERPQIFSGASVDIAGGNIGNDLTLQANAQVLIRGGVQGDGIRTRSTSTVTVRGNNFFFGDVPITTTTLDPSFDGSVWNGVYEDGTPFVLNAVPYNLMRFEFVPLPAIGPTSINSLTDPVPLGIRAGQTLNVVSSTSIANNFTAGRGSSVLIEGGTMGDNFEAVGANVLMTSGQINQLFGAYSNSVVEIQGGYSSYMYANDTSHFAISGGTIDFLHMLDDSTASISGGVVSIRPQGGVTDISGGLVTMDGQKGVVNLQEGALSGTMTATELNISGGTLDNFMLSGFGTITLTQGNIGNSVQFAGQDSSITVYGGTIGDNLRLSNGTMDVYGGAIGDNLDITRTSSLSTPILNVHGGTFGASLIAGQNSIMNLHGDSFAIDGVPLNSLILNQPFTITDRDVTLTGVFADGSPFSFDLNSTSGLGDYFSPTANLTVTLVPEPSSLTLALLIFGLIGAHRTRSLR